MTALILAAILFINIYWIAALTPLLYKSLVHVDLPLGFKLKLTFPDFLLFLIVMAATNMVIAISLSFVVVDGVGSAAYIHDYLAMEPWFSKTAGLAASVFVLIHLNRWIDRCN